MGDDVLLNKEHKEYKDCYSTSEDRLFLQDTSASDVGATVQNLTAYRAKGFLSSSTYSTNSERSLMLNDLSVPPEPVPSNNNNSLTPEMALMGRLTQNLKRLLVVEPADPADPVHPFENNTTTPGKRMKLGAGGESKASKDSFSFEKNLSAISNEVKADPIKLKHP